MVALDDTLMGNDIRKVINKGIGLKENFKCEFELHFGGVESSDPEVGKIDKLKLKKPVRLDIIRDFATSYTDTFFLKAAIPAGEFVKFIYPSKALMEMVMEFTIIDAKGEFKTCNWRLDCYLVDPGHTDLTDENITKLTPEQLNNIGMVEVGFQLVYREYFLLKNSIGDINGTDMTVGTATFVLISSWIDKTQPKVEGSPLSLKYNLETPDNSECKYETIRLSFEEKPPEKGIVESVVSFVTDLFGGSEDPQPPAPVGTISMYGARKPNVLEGISILQDVYGIYQTGCNVYLHKVLPKGEVEEEEKLTLSINRAIMPNHEATINSAKSNNGAKEIHIFTSQDKTIADNTEYTFGMDGDIVQIVTTSDIKYNSKFREIISEAGTNTKFMHPKELLNRSGSVKNGDEGAEVDNGKSVREAGAYSSIPTKYSEVYSDKDKNAYIESLKQYERYAGATCGQYSILTARYMSMCSNFVLTWNNANPFIINPGDYARIKISDINKGITEFVGSITNIFFSYDFTRDSGVAKLSVLAQESDYMEGDY